MSRSFETLLLAALATAWLACPALALGPDPASCYTRDWMTVSPGAEFDYPVIVRDADMNPINDCNVVVDFSACPFVVVSTMQEPGFTSGSKWVAGRTDAGGQVVFQMRAGGVCPGGPITVTAGGVLLRTLTMLATPDLNGDAMVGLVDFGMFVTDELNQSLESDFNGDGAVDVVELAAFADVVYFQRWRGYWP
ncbi:MAG TPA: hypothetical protein VMS93_04360 [Candidatus Saccharimonadales bacterium]|nr:hypothetical protein [Candidatus Saccharimonadales bacterium]